MHFGYLKVSQVQFSFFAKYRKGISYDVKGGVLYTIDQLGIGGNLFNWVNGCLHNRMIQV